MRKTLLLALLAALVFIVAGVAVLAVALTQEKRPPPEELFSETSSIVATATPETSPTPEPEPVSSAPVVRAQIPSIGVDAKIVILGVDPDGTMQVPKGPKDVAWYTFSAHPGAVGNVVLAGHVDYVNYGAAVFWHLRDLKPGDDVVLTLDDGLKYTYRISSSVAYDDATAPVAEIVGPTPTETITLITCTGTFDRRAREYDKRLVVKGYRVRDAP